MNCHNILSTFPEELGCLDFSSYAGRIPKKTVYLGGNVVLVNKPTIVGILRTNTSQIRQLLFDWWATNLLYGDGYFHVSIKFFGVVRQLVVRFTKTLEEVMKDVSNEVAIVLEIVDPEEIRTDISYVYGVDCDDTIECSTRLICT